MLIANKSSIAPFIGQQNEQIYELLNAANSQLDACSVAHLDLPPNTSTPKHYHPRMEEIYYVLDGEATLLFDRETYKLKAGDTVHIPSNTIHQINNQGPDVIQILTISLPPWTPEGTVDID